MTRNSPEYFRWLIDQALFQLEGCGEDERKAALAWIDMLRARAQ